MSKQDYWVNFYKKPHISESTNFSAFCLQFIESKSKIVELGCGNGRDTYFFGKQGFNIVGVDYACKPKKTKNINFIQSDIVSYFKNTNNSFNVIYSRFFLHSINNIAINKLLNWSKGLICLEFRAKDDIPILYTNHYRNNVDENKLLKKMLEKNFDLIYYSKSKDVAEYKNENPLVVRIIANKKEVTK